MAPRKNGHSHRFEQKTRPTELERTVDDVEHGTGKAGNEYEQESDDETDDFEDGELTDEDFAVDGEDEQDDT